MIIYPTLLILIFGNRHIKPKELENDVKLKMKEYDVKAVPTTIIDGKIKVVGIPDFPWICGDDLFKKLKREYPLKTDE